MTDGTAQLDRLDEFEIDFASVDWDEQEVGTPEGVVDEDEELVIEVPDWIRDARAANDVAKRRKSWRRGKTVRRHRRHRGLMELPTCSHTRMTQDKLDPDTSAGWTRRDAVRSPGRREELRRMSLMQ